MGKKHCSDGSEEHTQIPSC